MPVLFCNSTTYDNLIMSRRKFLLKITLFILLLCILAGFIFLSWSVSRDYFEYRTTPVIEISDFSKKDVVAPAIVVCYRFSFNYSKELKIGELFTGESNFF